MGRHKQYSGYKAYQFLERGIDYEDIRLREAIKEDWAFSVSLSKIEEESLYDPQTSGGLLLSVPAINADKLLTELLAAGVSSAVQMGEVLEGAAEVRVV